ncbi:hypothetical protein V6N13_009144 [Hibiscus sabdariffa]
MENPPLQLRNHPPKHHHCWVHGFIESIRLGLLDGEIPKARFEVEHKARVSMGKEVELDTHEERAGDGEPKGSVPVLTTREKGLEASLGR